jgi:hypothetical protein
MTPEQADARAASAGATECDIALAKSIAWSMSLEGQDLTDAGFIKVLDEIVAHRQAHPEVG